VQVKVTPTLEGGDGEEKRTDYGIELEVKDVGDGTYRVEYTRTKLCEARPPCLGGWAVGWLGVPLHPMW
jgi:hypothetical protein